MSEYREKRILTREMYYPLDPDHGGQAARRVESIEVEIIWPYKTTEYGTAGCWQVTERPAGDPYQDHT